MAHIAQHKEKILARITRMQGQLQAVSSAVNEDQDCSKVLQTLAACRGAMNGLMGEILEDHIRSHIMEKKNEEAALELIDVLKSYLK